MSERRSTVPEPHGEAKGAAPQKDKAQAQVIDVVFEPQGTRRGDLTETESETEIELGPQDERDAKASALAEGPVTVGDLVDGAKGVIESVGTTARRLVDRGRYRKLRISRKGKPIVPDVPLAAVAALEAASIYGAGWARVLAANVGARFLFDVEVVNDADRYFVVGQEALLEGNLERAEQALLKAVRIDDTHAGAYLQLGVLYRLKNEPEKARPVLERARVLDDTGETGKKAEQILEALD
ncbi:MAG: hypothetical protein IPK13_20370 [Deltaproteobacteria bacterium]|nr:hypothetical protein [Deltaproteobacteria bacterium]